MADKWAVATGNWSSTSTWNDGILPGPDDDVYADGFTVTVNQDVTVLSLSTRQRSGGVAGGVFTSSAAGTITITANLFVGSNSIFTHSTTNVIINGNLVGSDTTSISGIQKLGAGTLTINGNVTGGAVSLAAGVLSASASPSLLTINGNVNGGTGTNSWGLNLLNGTVVVNGSVSGGSNTSAWGINNANAAVVLTVNGSVIGGSASGAVALVNSSTGSIMVSGNAIGGTNSTAYGISNTSRGTVTLNGIAIASNTTEAVNNTSTGTFTVLRAQHAANGRTPWTGNGKIFFGPLGTTNLTINNSSGTQRMLGRVGG